MRIARQSDRHTEPLPKLHSVIPLDRAFTRDEMECIQRGYLPAVMEDKWFIYWEDGHLYFHRSWTGYCIYVVRFAREGESWRMVEALVNRDPSQYGETRDERDVQLISYLIDLLLLRKLDAAFPADGDSDLAALEMWSCVGRAALGQYPPDQTHSGEEG